MEAYREQDGELIYALDIGTRGVVGVVGRASEGRFHVLDMELAEHGRRTMIDGQIDNIRLVAELARAVTDRLEERLQVRLQRVCVAAAGRALRTEEGSFSLELEGSGVIDAEQISRLETGAVSAAEEKLQADEEARKKFFLVGYTVSQYRLDRYPLTSLLDHTGKLIEADVVATFLPGVVVESLYETMRQAGLQISSMTLEPIAAMNAAIPQELRLLNLALVDIGAGTTDIAICRDGAVVGYTMATLAGDEITEQIMKDFLVDFGTAERMKRELGQGEEIRFSDVLGLENSCTREELLHSIQGPMEKLAEAVAEQVLSLNAAAPSAVFLAGGGSRLEGLRELVAEKLAMDGRRVAIAGSNYGKSVDAEGFELNSPEYATPLGIALSAGLGLLNDSYMITLNGKAAKLFRSGTLTLRDILLMNGYSYGDMLPRSGKTLSVSVNGRRVVLRGRPGTPALLRLNGVDAGITQVVSAGDRIDFIPAVAGQDAAATVGQVLTDADRLVLVNEQEAGPETVLCQGDVVVTMERLEEEPVPVESDPEEAEMPPEPSLPEKPEDSPEPGPELNPVAVLLNGVPLHLPGKADGQSYFVMDLLEKTELDFEHLDRPVSMKRNGADCGFTDELKDGDRVDIYCE